MKISELNILEQAAVLLRELNGHSCTCSGCKADEKRGKELSQEILDIVRKRRPRFP